LVKRCKIGWIGSKSNRGGDSCKSNAAKELYQGPMAPGDSCKSRQVRTTLEVQFTDKGV
jgi:hypothetical protein